MFNKDDEFNLFSRATKQSGIPGRVADKIVNEIYDTSNLASTGRRTIREYYK